MATSKNEARTHLREQAFISEDILKSQQPCMIKDNLNILNQHIASLSSTEIKNHLKGLKAILEMLLVQVPSRKAYSFAVHCYLSGSVLAQGASLK